MEKTLEAFFARAGRHLTVAGIRYFAVLLFMLAALACYGAFKLSPWVRGEPGPGLFPQAVALALCVVAFVMALLPRPWQPDDTPTPALQGSIEGPDDVRLDTVGYQEMRTFAVYSVALLVLTAGSFYLGFLATSFLTAVLIVVVAERRPIVTAVVFALASSIILFLVFGFVFGVDLPGSVLDKTMLSFLRT